MNEPRPIPELQTVGSSVAVFNCVVHILREENGVICGRVANLPDLVFTAQTERDLLAKIVKEFKRVVREYSQSDAGIPWVEPPSPKTANEQTRLIPVHL